MKSPVEETILSKKPYLGSCYNSHVQGLTPLHRVNVGIFTIYYLAYPETDEHRADPAKFAIDTAAKLTSTLGLLELFHIHGSEKHEPGFYATGITPPNVGFGHLGFTGPNVQQAVARLRAHGVPILKNAGSYDTSLLVTDWEKQRGVGVPANGTVGKLHPDHAGILEQVVFVQDPVSLNLPQSLGETRLTFLESMISQVFWGS